MTPPDEQRLSLAPHFVVERGRKNGASVKASARVVLGLDEREVAEEVMHFLDRDGARVVGTAEDPRQLHAAILYVGPKGVDVPRMQHGEIRVG